MGLSRINSQSITDGSIATTDLADSAVTSAKIGVDVIAAEDLANNSITTAEITDGAVTQAKLASSISLGGYFLNKDGTSTTNASDKDKMFRVNATTTTGNITLATGDNASATGPITIGSGFTITVSSGARLAIV
jgi:hypothetical protein